LGEEPVAVAIFCLLFIAFVAGGVMAIICRLKGAKYIF
jgi:hypothetical protein